MKTNSRQPKRSTEAKTSRTAQRKGDYVQRRVRHCGCQYQKEKSWGYRIFKWVGGRKSWKPMITAASPGMAEILADDYKQVLIVCLGCGADMVREYVPNAPDQRPAD
jgi:hypothetical protein